jgi:hypothetical protein
MKTLKGKVQLNNSAAVRRIQFWQKKVSTFDVQSVPAE